MKIKMEFLNTSNQEELAYFISGLKQTFFYHTLEYKQLLEIILRQSKARYFIFRNQQKIIAFLPSFSMSSCGFSVINSLPFYGSHGSFIFDPEFERDEYIQQVYALFESYCKCDAISSCTFIESFFSSRALQSLLQQKSDLQDVRIGQLLALGDFKPEEQTRDFLFSQMHQKTRNMVRKGEKYGFEINILNQEDAFRFLYKTHLENLTAIGGVAKTKQVLDAIQDCYYAGKDYNLWVAQDPNDGQYAGAVLLFYHQEMVEYYMPVIHSEYRTTQVLSALLFKAMVHANAKGYKTWNWGGTWQSQESVYRFKHRWGSKDFLYRYYIKIYDKNILSLSPGEIMQHFPNYYLYPFTASIEHQQERSVLC